MAAFGTRQILAAGEEEELGSEASGEGREGEDEENLPAGWELVQPEGKPRYLLSPISKDGKPVQRVRVQDSYKMRKMQAPSKTYPNGRFHELNNKHFRMKRSAATSSSTNAKASRLQTLQVNRPLE
jgi:hypothetical protein